jgi:hypothetical protein
MQDDVSPTDPTLVEDLRFQRGLWKVERISWGVQVAIVLAALAGLAGGGPLSRATVESAGLAVDYPRIARMDSPAELTIDLEPSLVRGGEVRLEVDRRWLDGVEIERIVPEPEHSDAASGVTGFTFRVDAGSPARVRLDFKHRRMGSRQGRIAVEGGGAVTLSQWVYP